MRGWQTSFVKERIVPTLGFVAQERDRMLITYNEKTNFYRFLIEAIQNVIISTIFKITTLLRRRMNLFFGVVTFCLIEVHNQCFLSKL